MRFLKMYRSASEGAGGAPQAGNTPPIDPASSGQPPSHEVQDVASLPEWARVHITGLREEAANYRSRSKDRDELAAKVKEIEDAKLSEIDRAKQAAQEAQSRAQTIEAELKAERLARMIGVEAQKLNIVDPETATLLIQGKVEFDESGKPKNLPQLLEQLTQEKPFLVRSVGAPTPGAGASPANPHRGAGAGTQTFTRSQIANRAFYVANKTAIEAAMREGRIVD